MNMAALSARVSGTIAKSHIFRSVSLCQVVPRQSSKQLQRGLTWCQLKHVHSRSRACIPAQFQQSSRSGWRWLTVMATAGFSQGFLGLNFGKKDEDKKSDPLLRVYAEAKEAHMKQDYNKAEIRYHDAIKVAEEMLKLKRISFKTYIYAKTNIYDSLADMALAHGELEKAEGLYKETMKGCLQQGLPRDDNALIEISIKLSSIYAMMDRRPEAEQGLLFCIQSQDAKMAATNTKAVGATTTTTTAQEPDVLKEVAASREVKNQVLKSGEGEGGDLDLEEQRKDTLALLGMALETYGRFLMGHRRLGEAVPTLQRALGVAERVLGSGQGQYIVLLNDLATAHILLKEWDQATQLLDKAIAAATKIKSAQLPMLYCNLGAVFLRTSRLEQAQVACLEAQKLSTKGQHPPAFAMSQKCLEKIQQLKEPKSAAA